MLPVDKEAQICTPKIDVKCNDGAKNCVMDERGPRESCGSGKPVDLKASRVDDR